MEEETFSRFGVRSWEEALAVMLDDIEQRRGVSQGLCGVHELCYVRYEKQLKERREVLETYQKGALRPVTPLLLQDNDFWQAMLIDSNKVFQERLDRTYQKLEVPLNLLSTSYSYGEEFVRQMVEKLGDEIMRDKERTEEDWKTLLRNYFTEYMDHEVAGCSISQELAALEKKDPSLAGYMTLMSYQLRDDAGLLTKRLARTDFLRESLYRRTSLDWEILNRAMDFVDKILAARKSGIGTEG